MSTPSPARFSAALPADCRSRLLELAREVNFAEGTRLYAARVRMLMDADTAFGSALGHWVGQVLAHRLQAARVRLLDLYAPHGSGNSL
ncbi:MULTISPECIES: hypothetical protein [unclassified Streptomyces]|uniref:hypothetical protein n=1 Tax=unclassified Streptomyces TaxID=2593676 RepID=UPI002E2C03B9|nr:hypothetical protein [Streptomyces sp. NBC_01439]